MEYNKKTLETPFFVAKSSSIEMRMKGESNGRIAGGKFGLWLKYPFR